jgi:hypothetical protein
MTRRNLAHAALAKAEKRDSTARGKTPPKEAASQAAVSRPARRVLHLRLNSLAL